MSDYLELEFSGVQFKVLPELTLPVPADQYTNERLTADMDVITQLYATLVEYCGTVVKRVEGSDAIDPNSKWSALQVFNSLSEEYQKNHDAHGYDWNTPFA